MRAALVYNPGAGRRRSVDAAIARMARELEARGLRTTAWGTEGAGDGVRLARAAVEAGAEMVVACGGDGTANEVLQAVAGTPVALGVWPLGTANVLAGELGLPRALHAVADALAAGRTRRISVGRAGGRFFLLMAGIGLDAAVVQGVSPPVKRRIGQGAYWLAALRQLMRWPPPRFAVEVAGRSEPATLAVVANAARYGGGLRFTPDARMDDDLLDVCVIDLTARLALLRCVAAAFRGAHPGLPGVTCVRTRRLRASGAGAVPVHVDGELVGELPMEFQCVPAAVSVVVPAAGLRAGDIVPARGEPE